MPPLSFGAGVNAGKLDRRITIRRQGPPVDDGYTTLPGVMGDYCTRWASWKAANGRETFENQGNEAKAAGSFWVRYDSQTKGIKTTDFVAFDGRIWNILDVQQIDRNKTVEIIVVAGD